MAEAPPENFKCETMDSCLTGCKKVKLSFKWTIENFLQLQQANGEELQSQVFPSAMDQPAYWKVALYPRGKKKEHEDSVGLFLSLQPPRNADVRARFTFESKDIHGNTIVRPHTSEVVTFSESKWNWGYPSYLNRHSVTRVLKRLKYDTLVIHCSIIIFLDISHHSVCELTDMCVTQKKKFKMSYKWTIQDFLAVPQVNGEVLESKVFPSANEQPVYWKLRLYPNGEQENEGSVSLYVQLQFSELEKVSTKVTFVAEDIAANAIVEQRSDFHTFDNVSKEFGYRDYINRDVLTESLKGSANDTLVIHCSIVVFMDGCNIPELYSKWSVNVFNDACLSRDLQSLLLDESYSDFVINIDNRQFKVHKCILHARSSVFAAMLSSNMEESKSSEVTLDDVDPDVFEKALRFIYTEKLPMKPTDALDILPVADKYNIPSLKQKCTDVLRSRICKGNAVKTLVLADAHNLEKLKKVAVRYICWNADVISKTEDWSQLVASYPKLAAELFSALAVDKT